VTLIAQKDVPALNHANTAVEGAVEAGCTTEGHTGKTVCTDCGHVVSEGTTISALGHADENQDHVCDACGESLVEEAPATGDNGLLAAVVALLMSAVALVVTKRRMA
jgi:LPXTG-motif cell wall-anchored protein